MRLTLTFDLDDTAPKFGLSPSEMIAMYQQVMAETSLDEVHRNCILPMWLSARIGGDPRQEKAALACLADMSWQWPRYDEWRKRFKVENVQPFSWRRAAEEATRWPNPWFAQRMLILHDTLLSICHARFEFLARARLGGYKTGWEFRRQNQEVDEAIAERFKNTVIVENWSTWPPFYPGDHTNLSLLLSSR